MNSSTLLGTPVATRQIGAAPHQARERERGKSGVSFAEAMAKAEADARPEPVKPHAIPPAPRAPEKAITRPLGARMASLTQVRPVQRNAYALQAAKAQKSEEIRSLLNAQLLDTLDLLSQSSSPTDTTFDTLRNIVNTRSALSALSGTLTPDRGISGRGFVRGRVSAPPRRADSGEAAADKNKVEPPAASPETTIGALAAHFESGEDIGVIGYDRHGGTSYGKFQLSSRAGTMDQFIRFLRKQKPDWSKRLAAAGHTDTGGRSGPMPRVWKQLAAENPDLFESLQNQFVEENHYKPALQALARNTGLNPEKMSPALQEVLFSTAVQHGPAGAVRIFSRAMDRIEAKRAGKETAPREMDKSLIETVYALRSRQFGSSTSQVRSAVQSRLQAEKALALSMLENGLAPA